MDHPRRRITDTERADAFGGIVELFGIPIEAATMSQAVNRVRAVIRDHGELHIGVVNAAKITKMRGDSELRQAVLDSDVIYADGMSVVWASRVIGRPLPERIAGIDLMHEILKIADTNANRIYCLGASAEVLASVCQVFSEKYPNAIIAGSRHGYFSDDEAESVAADIRDACPDVLFVAITSPKKERFMARWADTINVPVIHGVGGSFDVVAGLVDRAPESWQKLGLEWLYRVKQEPGRLWKRYLITNTLFVWLTIVEFIRVRVFFR